MRIKRIGLDHVEIIAHQLAIATMQWDEPIPPFRTRFPKVLESCINAPFQTYNSRDLYRTFEAKCAIMFYLLVKNHPFQNGNKRLAVTTLLVFMFLNNCWLQVQPTKLYNLALWVAQSDPDLREAVMAGLNDFIVKYSKKMNRA